MVGSSHFLNIYAPNTRLILLFFSYIDNLPVELSGFELIIAVDRNTILYIRLD